nr:MerB-like organometallic lyase SaoL [Tissierella sp.]
MNVVGINTIKGMKNLKLRGKYSNITDIEQRVRKTLINYVVNNGVSFNINLDSVELLNLGNISSVSFKQIVNSLFLKKILRKDESGDINFLYPVSALPTNHRVTLADGRSFYAMCGIDAMGSILTFNQDIHIQSQCSQCGEKISIDIKNGNLAYLSSESIHVIHLDSDENEEWAGNC